MKTVKTLIPFRNLTHITNNDAIKAFNSYKDNGVIKTKEFNSNIWIIDDEYHAVTIDFEVNADDFEEYATLLEIDKDTFEDYLKIFILSRFGRLLADIIRSLTTDIKTMFTFSMTDWTILIKHSAMYKHLHIKAFIDYLSQKTNKTTECNVLKEQIKVLQFSVENTNVRNQRLLKSYNSYTTISEIINRFWEESDSIEEKLYYFPIWFWWNISGCIPMRPKEIVVTSENCLKKIKDEWQLILRKTAIKGTGKKKFYNIDGDYFEFAVMIPEDIADTINWYIQNTQEYRPNDIGSLFVRYSYKYPQKRSNKDVYYYTFLCICLDNFYKEIIQDRYGYEIIYDDDKIFLNSNQIQKVCLGDTRHLSAINAIQEGVPITTVKQLLGDKSDDIAAHYFSNASKYVECRAYKLHKRMLGNMPNFSTSGYEKPLKARAFAEVEGGWCYSDNYLAGSIEDCRGAVGPNGQLGYCSKCPNYRPKNQTFSDSAELYKREIDNDSKNILFLINRYKSNKCEFSDVLQAFLKERESEDNYFKYLIEEEGDHLWDEKRK